jgi:hypothetical protein
LTHIRSECLICKAIWLPSGWKTRLIKCKQRGANKMETLGKDKSIHEQREGELAWRAILISKESQESTEMRPRQCVPRLWCCWSLQVAPTARVTVSSAAERSNIHIYVRSLLLSQPSSKSISILLGRISSHRCMGRQGRKVMSSALNTRLPICLQSLLIHLLRVCYLKLESTATENRLPIVTNLC